LPVILFPVADEGERNATESYATRNFATYGVFYMGPIGAARMTAEMVITLIALAAGMLCLMAVVAERGR